MRHVCINCKKVFGEGAEGIRERTSDICPVCMAKIKERIIEFYRRRQREEGNPDCFQRCLGNCPKSVCLYYAACTTGDLALLPTVPNPNAKKIEVWGKEKVSVE